MTIIEVDLDFGMPPNEMRVSVDRDMVRITVSPNVEAATLAVLDETIGMAVADVMDQAAAPDEEPDGRARNRPG